MLEVLNSVKLLFFMPATNARAIFSLIKIFFRNSTTGNRSTYHIILNVHCGKSDQPNVVEVTKYFRGSNLEGLQVFGRF